MGKMNPKKENIEDIIALTPVQEGLLFHYLRDRDSTRYFEQLCLEVSGKIDIDIFRKAWHFVVETNEMLRTVYRWHNLKKPVQIVLKKFQLNLKCVDYTTVYFDDKETLIKEIKNKDRNETFDLREIPFRITLNKIKEDEVVILISNHHILYDGWSLGILLKEFFYAYDVFFHKKGITKPAKNRFSDYVKWIKNQDIDTLENYWEEYFKAPGNRYRAAVIERDNGKIKPGGHYRLKIDRILKNNLEGFVNKYKISLASVLHGAWSILLQNYNDTDVVIFDTTFSGRSAKVKGIETIVGLFINTLPFRAHVSPDKPVTALLKEIHHMLIESEAYQFTPLPMIDKYRVNHRQWFDSVVVIENYPLDRLLLRENGELKVRSYSIEETTRYDLTVLFTTFAEFNVQFTYNKDLFDEGRISGLAGHLEQIIEEIVRHPDKTVKEIEITVDRSHRQKIRGKAKSRQVETNAAPPANEIEKKLAEIWSAVFGLEKHRVSRCADFFQQGGHSLKAFNLISKISGKFNVNVPLTELFEHSSIRDLAGYIENVSMQKVQPYVIFNSRSNLPM
jgi:acyl carrier protein